MRFTLSSRMCAKAMEELSLMTDALKIFTTGVDAVLPAKSVAKFLKVQENTLSVENKQYSLNKNVYVIGFGKAVARMAETTAELLQQHLIEGIISVPEGTTSDKREMFSSLNGKIQILEGAKNNLPDANSLEATKEIIKFVGQCPHDSLLIVLISGGGSALLSLPIPPVTLDQKQDLIKQLSKSGADIHELNAVRKSLSLVKGGGIARYSSSSQIIALILSDVIGDPIDIIASGPTVRNANGIEVPMQILHKYNLVGCIPESIRQALQKNIASYVEGTHHPVSHVQNVVIGSNRLALEAAFNESLKMGYLSIILTKTMKGISRHCGEVLALLAGALYCKMVSKVGTDADISGLKSMCTNIGISPETIDSAMIQARAASESGRCLCVLFGGETTVFVQGNGVGGRNQELALSFSIKLNQIFGSQEPNILFLSAGTDGFDGPNDAAGAFGFSSLKTQAEAIGLNAEAYLSDNDTYHFYKKYADGKYHILTGHTGTNVMDIQVMLIESSKYS